jgi:hypothetical protein
MRKCVLFGLLLLALFTTAAAQAAPPKGWPTLQEQLDRDRVIPGSALERVIQNHQEFGMLHPMEAEDKIRVPLWLRVFWRKAHPEMVYDPTDPAGGYPHVLKEIHEWMETHQNLVPGPPTTPGGKLQAITEAATAGLNLRISGSATNARSESDIRVNYWDPTKIIAGSNNIGGNGQQAMFYSTDTGSTWGQTFLPLATGDAFHSDPTVDWFSDGKAIATAIGINSSATQLRLRSYISTNNGATWTLDGTFSGSQTQADKQIVWVDKSNTSLGKDNAYACWHNGLPQFVNRRVGSGGTWGATPLQVSGSESTGTAIGCDIKTNSNGDVFVFWPTTGNRRLLMAKSTNFGVSYGTPVIITTMFDGYDIGVPAFNGRRILIYASGGAYKTATKDNVYAVWTDLSGATGCTTATNEPGSNVSSTCKTRIYFSRSTNGGTTWSAPVKISNQAGLNDQFNPWLVVDETNGQLAVIYYDTVDDPGRKKTNVYYQASFDDGTSWSTPFKVTTAQTDETVSGSDSGNQYGDYNSLSGIAGTFFPSWTDRRNNAREEIWTAAIQEGGTCTPPGAPGTLSATASGSNTINLSWGAASGATSYTIERALVSGGPYTPVGTTSGTTFSDAGLTCNLTHYYRVVATNGCGSANSNQASATTGQCLPCSNQTLYTNGFETGSALAGWGVGTFVSGGSTVDWRGIQTCTAQTGSKIFRFGGNNCTANYGNGRFTYAQPNGTAGISVPAGSTNTTLSFAHRRRFESGYDGLTLAVSVNGTNYFIAPATAILSGASYNGTVNAACAPAGAGGLPFFTGIQTSFVNTTVNLDAVCNLATGGSSGCAGQAVRVGFTTISDCSANDDGAFLDNVTVTACVP